jgi:hypothetical protein
MVVNHEHIAGGMAAFSVGNEAMVGVRRTAVNGVR